LAVGLLLTLDGLVGSGFGIYALVWEVEDDAAVDLGSFPNAASTP
jgi:hypothetical protein